MLIHAVNTDEAKSRLPELIREADEVASDDDVVALFDESADRDLP